MIIVDIGWNKYVVNDADGLALAQILNKAELYKEVNFRDQESGSYMANYHVWTPTPDQAKISMTVVNEDFIKMCRLAGKPEE